MNEPITSQSRTQLPPQREPQLTERLKYATQAAHERAESSPFVRALVAARLTPAAYLHYLQALGAVYGALEEGLAAHAAHPALTALDLPALARSAALRSDLAWWQAAVGTALPVAEAARSYAQHLRALAAQQPHRLLAHAYVRYLGDLHGGQLFKARVARLARGAASAEQGNAFHDFGAPARVAQRIAALRAALNAAVLPAHEADDVLAEAVAAFERHEALFQELEARAHAPQHDAYSAL